MLSFLCHESMLYVDHDSDINTCISKNPGQKTYFYNFQGFIKQRCAIDGNSFTHTPIRMFAASLGVTIFNSSKVLFLNAPPDAVIITFSKDPYLHP